MAKDSLQAYSKKQCTIGVASKAKQSQLLE